MKSVIAATVLLTAILAAKTLAAPQSNGTVPVDTTLAPQLKTSPQNAAKNDTQFRTSTVAPQAHQVLRPDGGDIPGPSGSFSLVVYAAVLVTILAMVYLVVRNFRMRYDTVRAERYGFRIRRGRTDHEVQPLARDDEDEEILFDVRGNLR